MRENVPGGRRRTRADSVAARPRFGTDHRALPRHEAGFGTRAERWDQIESGCDGLIEEPDALFFLACGPNFSKKHRSIGHNSWIINGRFGVWRPSLDECQRSMISDWKRGHIVGRISKDARELIETKIRPEIGRAHV